MRAQTIALLSAAVGLAAAAQNGQLCIPEADDFVATTDYFPQKTVTDHSSTYSVSYGNVYKNVTVEIDGKQYLYQLVQCFANATANASAVASVPECSATADVPCSRFMIPLETVAVTGNLFLGMIEEIEAETTVKYTETAVVSPCVQANNPIQANASSSEQLSAVDAFFTETDSEIPAVTNGYYDKFVRLGVAEETTPMGRAEWVEFAGVFYNNESLSNYVVERVRVSYDIQSQKVASINESYNILWFTTVTDTFATVTSDAVLEQIASDAGATILAFGVNITSPTDLDAYLQSADAVVIEGSTLDSSSALEALNISDPSGYSFYRNGTVHVYQPNKHITDSDTVTITMANFDEQMAAAPDLVLSDIVKATRTIAPWSSASFMYLRRVDEARIRVSANADVCGLGVSRNTDPNTIRSTLTTGLVTASSSNPTGSVTYASLTDYFPDKFSPTYATDFSIAYHLTWKLVRNRKSNEQYVLIQRGTESVAPNTYIGHKRFYIPVQAIAIQNTPEVAIIAMLGAKATINYTTTSPDPCIIKGLEDGVFASLPYDSSYALNCDALSAIDVVYGTASCDNSVYASATSDPGPLNRVEWTGMHSAFHNKEARAIEITTSVASKYLCVKEVGMLAAQTIGKRPSVAVISTDYYVSGAFRVNRADYEEDLFYDAGGQNAAYLKTHSLYTGATTVYDSYLFYQNISVLKEALVDLDIFLDTKYYYGSYPNISDFFSSYSLTAEDTQYPFIANKNVFRLDKRVDSDSGYSEQFGRYVVEPDAAVQDYTYVMHPGATNSTETYFLRDVFADEAKVEMDAANCTDLYATNQYLTEETDICSLPCEVRTTQAYCITDCYWWLDSTCNSVDQTIPTDELTDSATRGMAPALVTLLLCAVALLI